MHCNSDLGHTVLYAYKAYINYLSSINLNDDLSPDLSHISQMAFII